MKIEYIKRGAETRLILLFAGWSTDARYYEDCKVEGWDTAVVSDYRDMSMPEIPSQYSTVYIIAYSLGVRAASRCDIQAAARIAVCGSPIPVSDEYGIPTAIYRGTADTLSIASLKKFHLRMAGDRTTYSGIENRLPSEPDIEALREELNAIAEDQREHYAGCRWDKAYIAMRDRIFPAVNLERYWSQLPDVTTVHLDTSHALRLSEIVKGSVPDTASIGEGFSAAADSYNDNALVQAEICKRIGDILQQELAGRFQNIETVLEIGPGRGLLTQEWSKIATPKKATYVDILPVPEFGVVENEEYVEADAEEWLKTSGGRYDLIVSASTIQWFADPVGFVRSLKNHLNPGGVAIIGTFVKGNLHQLDALRPSPIIYRHAGDYEVDGIEIAAEWTRTLSFPSSRDMLMHLRLTGVSPRKRNTKNASVKASGEASSPLRYTDLPCELTYRPIILLIR